MDSMRETSPSRHISVHIARSADSVYAYAADPAHLPSWAAGLAGAVEQHGDTWIVESPMGRVEVVFAPRNDFGVLDHRVTLPSGETFFNPLRVTEDGSGAEVVFTLRRAPDRSDADFDSDADAVLADLLRLKGLLESDRPGPAT